MRTTSRSVGPREHTHGDVSPAALKRESPVGSAHAENRPRRSCLLTDLRMQRRHRRPTLECLDLVALGREPGGGLVVTSDAFMTAHRVPVILAAARNNVPAVYLNSYFAREGGLLSYGPDPVDTFRRAASYVDRILRGEKPGDLPVQLPTKYEMVVNLKTAKALGLAIPPSIMLRADEVIE